MKEPVWVTEAVVLALHEGQITEHGGRPGLRDAGLLGSAMARPRQLFTCGDPDLADRTASYAFGLARNHPFLDGNKRASLIVSLLFLAINGYGVAAADDAMFEAWMALAGGAMDERTLAAWLRVGLVEAPFERNP